MGKLHPAVSIGKVLLVHPSNRLQKPPQPLLIGLDRAPRIVPNLQFLAVALDQAWGLCLYRHDFRKGYEECSLGTRRLRACYD